MWILSRVSKPKRKILENVFTIPNICDYSQHVCQIKAVDLGRKDVKWLFPSLGNRQKSFKIPSLGFDYERLLSLFITYSSFIAQRVM
jgi:hypothetical protein